MCLLALGAGPGGMWWYLAATADARRAGALVAELRGQEPGTVTRWLAALGWKQKPSGRDDYDIARELLELGPAAVPSLSEALTDHNWAVRATAVRLLASIGDRRAAKPLVRVMQSDTIDSFSRISGPDEGYVRKMAAHALGVIGDSSVTEDLVTVLGNKSADIRTAAIWALGRIGDPHAVQPLLKSIGDTSRPTFHRHSRIQRDTLGMFFPRVSYFAVTALDRLGPAAVPELIGALTSEDRTVRLSAARYLCYLTQAYKRAGWERFDPEPFGYFPATSPYSDYDAKAAHLTRLTVAAFRAARTAAIGPLIDRLSDTDADVRAAAAWALGHFGDPRAESALLKLFADPAKASRVFDRNFCGQFDGPFRNQLHWTDKLAETVGHHAMIAAGRITGDRAFEVLRAATGDDNPRVRLIAVAISYGVGGDKAAISPRALHDDVATVRKAVFGLLTENKNPRTAKAVRKAMDDPHWTMPLGALRWITDDDASNVEEAIAKALADPNQTVRREGMVNLHIRCMARLDDRESAALAAPALHSDDPYVRDTAMRILHRLSGAIVSNDTFQLVLAAAGAKSPTARATAVRALTAFDHPKALEAINAARNDPSDAVRAEAFNALHFRRRLPPQSMLRVSPE